MKTKVIQLFVALFLCGTLPAASAQGTAFTYQGRLNTAEGPANGTYDLTFTLYEGGEGDDIVCGPVTNSGVEVSNGLFALTVDFGSNVFEGDARWLEIGVSTNGSDTFTTLSPRQALLAVPYAIFANTASNLSGNLAAEQLTGTMPVEALPGALPNLANGNGAGLTNISAGGVTGLGSAAYQNTDFFDLAGAGTAAAQAATNSYGTIATNISLAAAQMAVASNAFFQVYTDQQYTASTVFRISSSGPSPQQQALIFTNVGALFLETPNRAGGFQNVGFNNIGAFHMGGLFSQNNFAPYSGAYPNAGYAMATVVNDVPSGWNFFGGKYNQELSINYIWTGEMPPTNAYFPIIPSTWIFSPRQTVFNDPFFRNTVTSNSMPLDDPGIPNTWTWSTPNPLAPNFINQMTLALQATTNGTNMAWNLGVMPNPITNTHPALLTCETYLYGPVTRQIWADVQNNMGLGNIVVVTNAVEDDSTNTTVRVATPIAIATNAMVPAPVSWGGYLWNSNNALYWVTDQNTNYITGP